MPFPLNPNPHATGCPWHSLAELSGGPNVKWCEQTLCAYVSEPANAWSNVAYLVAAALLLRANVTGSAASATRRLAWTIAWMGIFSFAYHASNTLITQGLDFLGMFLMLGVCVRYGLTRIEWKTERARANVERAIWMGSTVLILPMHYFGLPYQALVGVWTLVVLSMEFVIAQRARGAVFYLAGAAALIVAAAACSIADHRRFHCSPDDHILQGHALWHVLSAISLYALGRHWLAQAREPQRAVRK